MHARQIGSREQTNHWTARPAIFPARSEEHTSELQSLRHLVCRLLLEKKKKKRHRTRQRLERHEKRRAPSKGNNNNRRIQTQDTGQGEDPTRQERGRLVQRLSYQSPTH